jgi:hypothetical protein
MQAETTFLENSKSVVKAFLSSVVLVDDRAYLSISDESVSPTTLVPPGRQGATRLAEPVLLAKETGVSVALPIIPPESSAKIASAETLAKQVEPQPEKPPSKRDHTLNGKTVIDVFAQIGVVCAVLRPAKDELAGLNDLVMSVGANADVVILDWVLCDSQLGERTLELIKSIVASAAASGRARLILIYTAEADLIAIEKQIRKTLDLVEAVPTDTLTIISAGTRICVYGKAGTLADRIGDQRIKTPAQLPEVVISEFTEMTKGLLSNVAMKSIASIREKTFQLLSRFDSTVDAPYVTQSALISPERAEEQVPSLIVSEIQEILEDENVGSLADYGHIVEWLDDRIANGLTLPDSTDLTSSAYYAGLVQLLKDGVRKEAVKKLRSEHAVFAERIIPKNVKVNGKDKEPAKYVRESLTGILRSNPSIPHKADETLAMLMSLRHRYSNPSPQLTLGAIISRTEDAGPAYLLCLQPLCDSVRLKEARRFPFLCLETATNTMNCELIVSDGDDLKYLTLKASPYLLEMISFCPKKDEVIMAEKLNDGFYFTSTSEVVYKWIANLKPAHAQRVANHFAHTFSRVGLIESEWHRLGSKL